MTTHLVAWMLTYLMHSTLWIGGAALLAACGVPRRAAARATVWRAALCGGVLTASLASLGMWPHYGPTWSLLADAENAEAISASAILSKAAPAEMEEVDLPSMAAAAGSEIENTSATSRDVLNAWLKWLVAAWLVGASIMLARIALDWWRLGVSRRKCMPAPTEWWSDTVEQLAANLGMQRPVEVLISPTDFGPACTGLGRGRIFVPETLSQCLSDAELEALAAHELAHLARRDPAWSIAASVISGVVFFQPLNWYARRQMDGEAEYAADELAAVALADGGALADCLLQYRDWAVSQPMALPAPMAVAVGMATFRSALGRRVERLIAFDASRSSDSWPRGRRRIFTVGLVALMVALPGFAPRAVGVSPQSNSTPSHQEDPMRRQVLLTTVAVALLAAPERTPAADETKPAAATQAASGAQVDQFPDKLHGFMGRIRGTIVDKDPEKGTVTIKITELQRVWKGSTAAEPDSCVGKTFVISGVFGKFLDTLIVLDRGESIDIGARNLEGDKLAFPGELLKKSDPNEKFDKPAAPKPAEAPKTVGADAPKAAGPIPQGMAGFRGMIRGRVVSKDPEKGKVILAVDAIVKTWPKNQAQTPQEAVGKELPIEGIFGKFLDVLITVEKGDRVEIEAFHNNGNAVLTFPGEWLKKVD